MDPRELVFRRQIGVDLGTNIYWKTWVEQGHRVFDRGVDITNKFYVEICRRESLARNFRRTIYHTASRAGFRQCVRRAYRLKQADASGPISDKPRKDNTSGYRGVLHVTISVVFRHSSFCLNDS